MNYRANIRTQQLHIEEQSSLSMHSRRRHKHQAEQVESEHPSVDHPQLL